MSPRRAQPRRVISQARPTGSVARRISTIKERGSLSWWQKLMFWRRSRKRLPSRELRDPKTIWKRRLKRTGVVLGALTLVVVIAGASVFAYYIRDLPNPRQLTNRSITQSTQILARDGTLLYTFSGDINRRLVTSEEIAESLKQAVIALEDAQFYEHGGISYRGTGRAVICGVGGFLPFCRNRVAGGGSTITQQYVRNALDTIGTERSADRKLREILLALEVEQTYTKDEILIGYLNEIPFGSNLYGVESAARGYFNKPAKDLTVAESATLAAMIQAPSRLNPFGSRAEELLLRKDFTLDRMVEAGYLTVEQAEEAKKQELAFRRGTDITAPHFVFYVREQLLALLDPDPDKAEEILNQGGFTVTTSLDLPTQRLAEEILAERGPKIVQNNNASNAALVAIDPRNGDVLAMVGSYDYVNSYSGNTNFATSRLQPGSSFKPIVFASNFEQGINRSPASTYFDLETSFGNYRPNNFNNRFSGPVSARDALARSLNIPAVKAMGIAGIKRTAETAQKLGVASITLERTESAGLPTAIGAVEVQPLEMARAFGAFANGGISHPSRPILKVVQGDKTIFDFSELKPVTAVTPEAAWQISDILSDNAARTPTFGARSVLVVPGKTVAAKTGTTQNFRDGWVVGYTPQVSVAVWTGNNKPNGVMRNGDGGSAVAGPIWNQFMTRYLKDRENVGFTRPASLRQVTVERLSGLLPTEFTPESSRITEWLAPWQIPRDSEQVHTCVDGQARFAVQSERPRDAQWQAPVDAWANANVQAPAIPCSQPEPSPTPTPSDGGIVAITSPANGATVSGTITLSATAPPTTTQVEFRFGGATVAVITAAPWQTTYNTLGLTPGTYQVEAIATLAGGGTRTAVVTVRVGPGI